MAKQPFEMVTHTADIAVVIRGDDVADLLRNAARALYAIMLRDGTHIGRTMEHTVRLDSVDVDALLIDWLNELIYLAAVERAVFSKIQIRELCDGHMVADCCGEKLDPARHQIVREVKAATHHMSHIDRRAEGYLARVVFDV